MNSERHMRRRVKKYTGIAASICAAFFFGTTAAIGKLTYAHGSNPIMLTVLRGAFALPVLFVILKWLNIPLKVEKKDLRTLLIVGLLSAPAPLSLYTSFKYLTVGAGTVLQFIFPVIVALVSAAIYKQKLNSYTIAALILSMLGVSLFYDGSTSASITGFLYSMITAVSYSIYILGVGHTRLKHIHFFKISFYFSLIWSTVAFVFAALTNQLTFDLEPRGWLYSLIVSLFVVVVGYSMFQLGIKLTGPTTASILSTVEPISGNIAGIILLGETLIVRHAIAALIIIGGVILVSLGTNKNRRTNHSDRPALN
jgi:drug/metabolite transporter (DMT)-like permease